MVLVYFDSDHLTVSPHAGHFLQTRLAEGGISCGSIIVGVSPKNAADGYLYWKFDGCPTVEVTFPREEIGSINGAERIAAAFVERWHEQFATSPESCSRQECGGGGQALDPAAQPGRRLSREYR